MKKFFVLCAAVALVSVHTAPVLATRKGPVYYGKRSMSFLQGEALWWTASAVGTVAMLGLVDSFDNQVMTQGFHAWGCALGLGVAGACLRATGERCFTQALNFATATDELDKMELNTADAIAKNAEKRERYGLVGGWGEINSFLGEGGKGYHHQMRNLNSDVTLFDEVQNNTCWGLGCYTAGLACNVASHLFNPWQSAGLALANVVRQQFNDQVIRQGMSAFGLPFLRN